MPLCVHYQQLCCTKIGKPRPSQDLVGDVVGVLEAEKNRRTWLTETPTGISGLAGVNSCLEGVCSARL